MRRAISTVWLCAAAAVAGCGVPTGADSFEPIADDEIGRLADAATTTVPTTTLPATTTIEPPVTEPSPQPTTTAIPIAEEPVNIYFLLRGRLTPFPQNVTAP
ncbi:MAG: hypothetical protein AAGD33_05650, partial [Actinomycetota bacterium]